MRELLEYDASTGALTWKVDFGKHVAGTAAGHIHKRRKHGRTPTELHLGGFTYQAHNLIWTMVTGEAPDAEVDHVNRDASDNRWDNLRPATRKQNQANTGLYRNNKCGIRGIHFIQRLNRWRAMISVDGRNLHLGYFDTSDDAAQAWRAKAQEVHGEFAAVRCG